jgi:hypothetical protein
MFQRSGGDRTGRCIGGNYLAGRAAPWDHFLMLITLSNCAVTSGGPLVISPSNAPSPFAPAYRPLPLTTIAVPFTTLFFTVLYCVGKFEPQL